MKQTARIAIVFFGVVMCAGALASQPIFEAAKKGDLAALKSILAAEPGLVNAAGPNGRIPLMEAIWARQGEAARFLIEAGSDVNQKSADGIAPLAFAAFTGDASVAALLIERGADIGARDSGMGATALHLAALAGQPAMLTLLIDKGAPLDARTNNSQTPLAMAVERGQRECAKILVARGADVRERDAMDRTLLHRAVLAGDAATVKTLLDAGADPLVRSAYGSTALDLAAADGLTEMAGLLGAGGKLEARAFPVLSGPYLGQAPPGRTPRLFAPGIVSTERDELNAVFTPDGKEFYFTIRGASGRWTIMLTSLDGGRWSKPRPASFSGRWSDVDLFITADGRRLFFCSNRPLDGGSGPAKDFDIWISERTAAGWSEPKNPGAPVNSAADEFYPALTGDGTIYFQSRRPGGPGAPDIWRARPEKDGFSAAECLPAPVNSTGFEGDTLVAPDESWVIVSTSRDPRNPRADLFLSSRRADGAWGPLVKLDPAVSSPASGENCQMLSPDGRYLFFTRDGDIYWVDAAVLKKAGGR